MRMHACGGTTQNSVAAIPGILMIAVRAAGASWAAHAYSLNMYVRYTLYTCKMMPKYFLLV